MICFANSVGENGAAIERPGCWVVGLKMPVKYLPKADPKGLYLTGIFNLYAPGLVPGDVGLKAREASPGTCPAASGIMYLR